MLDFLNLTITLTPPPSRPELITAILPYGVGGRLYLDWAFRIPSPPASRGGSDLEEEAYIAK